jgi:hypothetical protein
MDPFTIIITVLIDAWAQITAAFLFGLLDLFALFNNVF